MKYQLRPWKISDIEHLIKYADNPKIAVNMTDGFPTPYTRENGQNFLDMATQNPDRLFAIIVNHEAVGGIGIHPLSDIQRKNAELGYWLAEPYWNNGIVSSAIRKVTTIAFQNFDITRFFARPFGTNLASQKVLEKVGYKLEARLKDTFFKNGKFIDELIYSVRKNDWNCDSDNIHLHALTSDWK
ncbi:MAG: GNAT family N-acetyltransferase [Crocinitomicaceae bacterium]|nr:GNAT family N-acetyltransferase [Crocinitomicaceae bacterium]MBK8925700.1 GNAT family N-acetyltransferase [Crocinitomicaceae bacterium]